MDKAAKLNKLYSELNTIETALREFVEPRSANHPREWSQEETDKHRFLIKQRNDIVAEIAELEGSHP